MRWLDRIDQMEQRGGPTADDIADLCKFSTCLLGEACADAGISSFYDMPYGPSRDASALASGTMPDGPPHPAYLAKAKKWDDLRALQRRIQDLVATCYPPKPVEIKAQQPELVEA